MKKIIEINPLIDPWGKTKGENGVPKFAEFVGAYEYREWLINEAIASLFISEKNDDFILWSAIDLDGSFYTNWYKLLECENRPVINNVVTQKKTGSKTKAIRRMISIYNASMNGFAGLERRVL